MSHDLNFEQAASLSDADCLKKECFSGLGNES